ncbi:MAG: MBL fold metallo-hydrolase [Clostridiales bacterium]|nr:MBL fold metallo-hydrolase [Clostridiales bacterium]
MYIEMYLTVLGCEGPYPSAGHATSGYLLSSDSGKTNIAIDMGSGVLSRLRQNIGSLDCLDAVILSHLHFDHMSDMGVLGYMLDFSGLDSLKLICPATPASALSLVSGKFDRYLPGDMRVGEFDISFIRVKHPVETYALKVVGDGACFVYTGDTNICPEISIFADGSDLLLADACFLQKEWSASKPHMSAGLCGKLAREANAGELVLTHFRPESDTEELLDEARSVFPNCRLAEEGLRIRV